MKGAVAAGHPVTAEAALEVLRAGGNAFDAAIAAVCTACVAEPVLCSLGGGGFMLARGPGQPARLFDFFAQTPVNKNKDTHDFYPVVVDFGDAQQEFHIGLGACATPGCVKGLFEVQRQLGSMSMRELVQPALAAARQGVGVTELQGFIFSLVAPIYTTLGSAGVFNGPDAKIAGTGCVLRMPEYADMLEVLAIEGADLFYRGEIAKTIIQMCAGGGGHLTRPDLHDYQTEVRKPLQIDYGDARILTNPPPSSGGLMVAFALRLLADLHIAQFTHNDYDHLRRLVDVMRASTRARADHLMESVNDAVLDEELLEKYRAQVYGHPHFSRGTTHISVADSAGNVAAVTISNGEGCGYVVPGTGIMLNNMLGEEDLNPKGFGAWACNQRMSSMMAPSVVLLPGDAIVVTGSGGSNRIRTALMQVFSNLIDFKFDEETAVTSSRIHIEDEVLNIEAGVGDQVIERLTEEFPQHRLFKDRSLFFGGAHTVSRRGSQFRGAGDPRRGGVFMTTE